jgi:Putative transposase
VTMVLHTHSRKLNFHPHIHVIVPGGAVNKGRRCWKKVKGKYLFHQESLAEVFRARFLEALREAGLILPKGISAKWVVHCTHVSAGITALKYLSSYLYRGVISEKNIIASTGGNITFKYVESDSGKTKFRTLPGEEFLWLILQHVLPRGFRRVRDYGFLHGNAKKLLTLVQLILRVIIAEVKQRPRPAFKCPRYKSVMHITEFRWANSRPG